MKTQLKVLKADGTFEEYLHTKVMGTINNALGAIGRPDIYLAEQLAEVATYYLYHRNSTYKVSSNEIFSIIKAVLTATGYEDAAVAISEHRFERRIKRCRIEVISADIDELTDAEQLCAAQQSVDRSPWDKTRIVRHLMSKYGICQQTARAIASMAEERIFNLGLARIPSGVVRQLVLGDAAAVLRAERQLQAV